MTIPYETAVRDYYRQEVAARSGVDAADRRECVKYAQDRIAEAIACGEVEPPEIGEQIRRDVLAVDESDKRAADRMLDMLLYGGQEQLEFYDLLDVVATLGKGRRKSWRNVSWQDVEAMEQEQFDNLNAQVEAYAKKRPMYQALRDALMTHGSVEAVYAAGPLLDE